MIFSFGRPGVFAAALFVGAAAVFPHEVVAGGEGTRAPSGFSTQGPLLLEDLELNDVVGAEWPDFTYDGATARAARAYAARSAELGGSTLASDELRQILGDAGVPESTALCAVVSTTEGGFGDVLDHLRTVMPTAGEITHIGLGKAPIQDGPFRWLWAILLIERRIDLAQPVPFRLTPESATPLRFRLRRGWRHPTVLVQYPDGLTRRMRPVDNGGEWFTVVPVGRLSGRLTVQILADGPLGPRVAAQMPIRVGAREENRQRTGSQQPPVDESSITSSREAEALLADLVNADRFSSGLPALQWDADLAGLARAHSGDMVEQGFFGHVSPTNGDLKRRLREAGFTTDVARENVARDTSVAHAHGSLMASPGHRSNVLAPDVDRVGIGIVRDRQPGTRLHWVVTEIFIRPQVPPWPDGVLEWRENSQPASCHRDPTLDELAVWFVTAAPATAEVDAPTFDELKQRLDATGLPWARMSTEVAVVRTLDEVGSITKVDQRQYSSCGMAARTIEGVHGRDAVLLAVVLIEPR